MATTYETDPRGWRGCAPSWRPTGTTTTRRAPARAAAPSCPTRRRPAPSAGPGSRRPTATGPWRPRPSARPGDEASRAEAALTREVVDRWLDLEDRLREHREVLHGPLRSLPEDARLRAAYADPAPDTADGRAVYREPCEGAGVTERSKAFFLLNRHRLGAVVAASMGDFEGRGRGGASEACLRLYDDVGRVLALAGCTAGYGGEGPHGTLYVLRLCGFPEGDTDARGATALERTVFGARTFFLRRGASGIEGIGR